MFWTFSTLVPHLRVFTDSAAAEDHWGYKRTEKERRHSRDEHAPDSHTQEEGLAEESKAHVALSVDLRFVSVFMVSALEPT